MLKSVKGDTGEKYLGEALLAIRRHGGRTQKLKKREIKGGGSEEM